MNNTAQITQQIAFLNSQHLNELNLFMEFLLAKQQKENVQKAKPKAKKIKLLADIQTLDLPVSETNTSNQAFYANFIESIEWSNAKAKAKGTIEKGQSLLDFLDEAEIDSLKLAEAFENYSVERLKCLSKLATIRQISIDKLIEQLGLNTHHDD
jgi:hypothetical protein